MDEKRLAWAGFLAAAVGFCSLGWTYTIPMLLDRLNGLDHLAGRADAPGRIFLQQLHYQLRQRRRDLRIDLSGGWRRVGDHGHQSAERVVSLERQFRGTQAVEDDAEAEQIGAMIDLLAACLLGSHV